MWQPIETAPKDTWLLCWWTPINDNPYAESPIIAQVPSREPDKFWHGHYPSGDEWEKGYGPLERLTHWMPLPEPPQ